jgi:hypothetical protein
MGGVVNSFVGRASEIAIKGTELDKEAQYVQEKRAQEAENKRLEEEAAGRLKLEEENRLKAEGEAKAALEAKTARRKRSSSLFAGSAFDKPAQAQAPGKKTLLGY